MTDDEKAEAVFKAWDDIYFVSAITRSVGLANCKYRWCRRTGLFSAWYMHEDHRNPVLGTHNMISPWDINHWISEGYIKEVASLD